jgi:hypothetical protein
MNMADMNRHLKKCWQAQEKLSVGYMIQFPVDKGITSNGLLVLVARLLYTPQYAKHKYSQPEDMSYITSSSRGYHHRH